MEFAQVGCGKPAPHAGLRLVFSLNAVNILASSWSEGLAWVSRIRVHSDDGT